MKKVEALSIKNLVEKKISIEEADINAIVAEIADLTDRNNHTLSLLMIAKDILKDKRWVDVFESLVRWQDKYSFYSIPQARYPLYQEFMEVLKKKLSPDDYRKIQNAL